jgi:DNA polymerase III sliding clamp (beta) subunit (PCNA family)
MKIDIKQSILVDVLEKGSVPALSDEAQTDTTNLSPIYKSVKISVDKDNLTVESSTKQFSIKSSIPVQDNEAITVEEEGEILISAKELVSWIKQQGGDSIISINLSKLEKPELINIEEMDSIVVSEENKEQYTISKVGSAKIVSKESKNTSKTNMKWELDCYDPKQLKSVNFDEKCEKIFDITTEQLNEAISRTSFASMTNDYEHIYDGLSIQSLDKDICFVATDTKRCVSYKVPSNDVSDIAKDIFVVIPCKLFEKVSKILGKEEKVSFYYNSKSDKAFMKQSNIDIRLSVVTSEKIQMFSKVVALIKNSYKTIGDIAKGSLVRLLNTASIVNNSSALFTFSKDNNSTTIKAISETSKYKPGINAQKNITTTNDYKHVWNVSHFGEGLRVIKSEAVTLSVPTDNPKYVKVSEVGNDNFNYFVMNMNNPKYDV